MRATTTRAVGPVLVTALAATQVLSGAAAAKKNCSPSAGSLAPRITSPCAGATIRTRHDVTWR